MPAERGPGASMGIGAPGLMSPLSRGGEKKPRGQVLKTIMRLWHYLASHRMRIAAVVFLAVLSNCSHR